MSFREEMVARCGNWHSARGSSWRLLGCSLFCAAMMGCFGAYDSSWFAQKQAQKNFASQQSPERLQGRGDVALSRARARRMTVRAYATRAYAAQVLDWPKRFAETLADGNRVLAPELGIDLQLTDATNWTTAGEEDDVTQLLERLRAKDDGADVDWVVGLVGSVPRFETSFHQLGVADLVGKHVVIRSVNDVAEHQAIEQSLLRLSASEREGLSRKRYQHKVTAVWLHELGHTLGALHDKAPQSLMQLAYSHESGAFLPASLAVMRHVLANRTPAGSIEQSARPTFVGLLADAIPSPWLVAERDAALSRWSAAARPVNPPPTQSVDASAAPQLSAAEQRSLEAARALQQRGEPAAALEIARPLAIAHPDLYVLQDFRCQLAMQQGMAMTQLEAECAGLMQLMPAAKKSSAPR